MYVDPVLLGTATFHSTRCKYILFRQLGNQLEENSLGLCKCKEKNLKEK